MLKTDIQEIMSQNLSNTSRQIEALERIATAQERIADVLDRVAGNVDLITDRYVGDENLIKLGDFR